MRVLDSPSRYVGIGTFLFVFWVTIAYDVGDVTLWAQRESIYAAATVVLTATAVGWTGLERQVVWSRVDQFVPRDAMTSGVHPWLRWMGTAAWLGLGGVLGALAGAVLERGTITGRPNPWLWLTVVATVACACALGELSARLLPLYLGPLLAGMTAYLLVGMAMYSDSWARSLFPLANGAPPIGMTYSPTFLVGQSVFMVAVAGLASWIAFSFGRLREHRLGIALGLACVALLGSYLATRETPVGAAPVTIMCERSFAEVCGPSELAFAFDEIQRVVARFHELGGERIEAVRVGGMVDGYDFERGSVHLSVGSVQAGASAELARLLVKPLGGTCENGQANALVGEAIAHLAVPDRNPVSDVALRIAAALERAPAWLGERIVDLRACRMSVSSLPGMG